MTALAPRRPRAVSFAAAAATLLVHGCASRPEATPALGAPADERAAPVQREIVEDFALLDQAGEQHALYANDDARAVVLVSYGVGCPILRWSLPRIEELAKTYRDRGVRFFYVDPNRHDTRADLVAEAREFGLDVPILADEAQLVLAALHVERTAEAILVDTRDWHVAYRGKIDDRATYGGQSGRTPVEHLGLALDAFLAGRAIAEPRTAPEGCLILYEHADHVPSYSAEIAPILAQHCVPCHTPGGIAPWAMASHERVLGWSPMIREVVRTKRMPPWHADPHVGTFENDRSLAPDEASALVRWIEAGSPRGEGADPLLAAAPPTEEEWPLGPPDLVLEATEQHLPPQGIVPYRYDAAAFEVTEDLWVRGAHLKPSNYPVLHHSVILIDYPDELASEEPMYQQGVAGYFTLYVPSMRPRLFPPGTGKLIPKGSRILFQFHYTTTGKPEIDAPRLGLYLLDEEPPMTFASGSAFTQAIDIPPGEGHYEAVASKTFTEDTLLYDLIPHMHFRGRKIRYEAHYPDGTLEVLLSVPNYDFNWQTSYHLAEPKLLPAGTVVECHALFDNSARNPFNPDPTQRIVWGPHSTDEMLTGYMNYHAVAPKAR